MGAGSKFSFTIEALDKYTKTLRDLNKKAAQSIRPLQQGAKSLGAFGRELHLDKVGAGLDSIAKATARVAESMGIASPAMQAIGALGMRAGFVAAAAGAAYAGVHVAKLGTNALRTSSRLGMSAVQLQRFRGAAELAGLSADDMDESLTSLGETMQNARYNRDPKSMALFNRFTHGIAVGPDGTNDVGEQMKRILEAASKIADPYARQRLLADSGAGNGVLPLAGGGRDGLQSLMDQADAKGYVLRGEALANSVKFNTQLWEMNVALSSLTNTVGSKVLPGLTGFTKFMDKLVEHPWKTLTFQNLGDSATPQNIDTGTGGVSRVIGRGARGVAGSAAARSLNNPGNLRNPGGVGFQQFDTPEKGLQAMANLLGRYQDIDHLDTVSGIIHKYAPSADGNNEAAYNADVNSRAGFDPAGKVDVHAPATLARLMSAMVVHEKGSQPFTQDQYMKAASSIVTIEFKNTPPGVTATAKTADGANMPTRIDRSMATHLSTE